VSGKRTRERPSIETTQQEVVLVICFEGKRAGQKGFRTQAIKGGKGEDLGGAGSFRKTSTLTSGDRWQNGTGLQSFDPERLKPEGNGRRLSMDGRGGSEAERRMERRGGIIRGMKEGDDNARHLFS